MQPKMCIKCKKNIAVLFITRIENGKSLISIRYTFLHS